MPIVNMGLNAQAECVICQDVGVGRQFVSLECGHGGPASPAPLHLHCMNAVFEAGHNEARCPMCRDQISWADFMDVYAHANPDPADANAGGGPGPVVADDGGPGPADGGDGQGGGEADGQGDGGGVPGGQIGDGGGGGAGEGGGGAEE